MAGYSLILEQFNETLLDLSAGRYQKNKLENVDFNQGTKHTGELIEIENVTIYTPKSDVLVQNLSLSFKKGDNILVSGPNASGKSSFFRILASLWPLQDGSLTTLRGGPTSGGLFFVPQRVYLPIGTLRDQVIYPDTQEDMKKKSISDDDIL